MLLSLINIQSFDVQALIALLLSSDLFLIVAGAIGAYGLLLFVAVIVGIVKSVKNRKTAKARVMFLRESKELEEQESEQHVSENNDSERDVIEKKLDEPDEEVEETEESLDEEDEEFVDDEEAEETEESLDEEYEETEEPLDEEDEETEEPLDVETEESLVEEIIDEESSFEYVTYEPDEEETIVEDNEESVVEEPIKEEKPVLQNKKKSVKNSPTALSAQLKKAKKAKVKDSVFDEETNIETKAVTSEPKVVESESKETVVEEEKKSSRYVGKWKIKEIGDGEFSSFLYASNGQLLLTSEVYASADGARAGIATITKNVALEKFEIHSDKNGRYFYKVKSSANRLLCVGETYNTKNACLKSVASVKKFCQDSIILDTIEKDITIIKYVSHDEIEVKPGYDGKWTIEGYEDFYMAKLFASNGELLLVGESFKIYESAKLNIETIRKNALASNFIIDKDKKGKFYYKLRNAQKSILCVGESYDTLAGVERAIESVKRFAKTAKLVETVSTEE